MNKMKQFIDFKQSLLEERGVTTILVPKDQVIDIPDFDWENFYEGLKNSGRGRNDNLACPYCVEFPESCLDCPMYKADNGCVDGMEPTGTYSSITKELGDSINTKDTRDKLLKFLEDEFGCGKKN